MKRNRVAAAVLACSACQGASAVEHDAGTWITHLRYRHESVQDDAFVRHASADTLRLRLGWSQQYASGFALGWEAEGVAELSDDFNSGANAETAFPVVADARALELNQAWVAWRGELASATLGRQRILLDNQRFVGNVGWRQNEQTFDALALDVSPSASMALHYYFLDRVHRVAGDEAVDPLARERNLSGHLANAAWTLPLGSLVGYAYWVEDHDVAVASTQTFGMRWTGNRSLRSSTLAWQLEAARQYDHADNPRAIDVGYWLAEAALTQGRLTGKLGWEHLGSDGSGALQTPLATLHAFNGWADKFTTTPVNGLEDRYLLATGKTGTGGWQDRLIWTIAWHDYRAERGGDRYGSEWDASLAFPLPGGLMGLLKLADFRSDRFARDTTKAWLQVEWSY
ncbi:MAG: alginate export family protein [Pseudomarimonas sp.]